MVSGLPVQILWVVYTLMVIAWISASAVLSFHWRSYAHGDSKTRKAALVYHIGSVLLLLVSGFIIASL